MTDLLCPNCRERLSGVEQGYGGVWSCLYCEGTWLSARQFEEFASCVNATSPDAAHAWAADAGICPNCAPRKLATVACGPVQAGQCHGCGGAFLHKGLLTTHAPRIPSVDAEAPTPVEILGMLGRLLLGDSRALRKLSDARRSGDSPR